MLLSRWARARQRRLFADQFESDGDSYLYRRWWRDAPVRVSAAERELFIADYYRRQRRTTRLVTLATFIGVVGIALVAIIAGGQVNATAIYLSVAVLTVAMIIEQRRAWSIPLHALAGRPAVGIARSRPEIRRVMLARTGYGTLLGGAAFAALLAGSAMMRPDGVHGRQWLWPVLLLVLSTALVSRAIGKWRDARSDRSA